jgi:hypothetical protein
VTSRGAILLHEGGSPPVDLRISRPVQVLSAGNHHPVLCEMEDATGPAGLWVVKPCLTMSRGTNRGTAGILAELAGVEVCAWAGVLAPRVGLARFSAKVDEAAVRVGCSARDPPEQDEIVQIFKVNQGRLAFCARYLEGAPDLSRAHLRRKAWRESSARDAVRLLVADAYMRHDDREVENANAVWHANRLVAIDHGSAFAGILQPGIVGNDLAARTVLQAPKVERHVAYEAARRYGTDADWEDAVMRLEAVPKHAIVALRASWPAELDRDDQNGQNDLRARFARFLAARGGYVRELAHVLRTATNARKA